MSWVRRRLSLLMIRWYCVFFSSVGHPPELEGLREEADEGERGLELVADVRHEVALQAGELELAADVRPHEDEPGQQHQVDEADEGGLGHREPPHLLLDRPVPVAQVEPHPLEGGRRHRPLHLEALVAAAAGVLVEHLPARPGHPDDPGPLRVDELLLEELADEAPVGVVAGEAEAHDAQLVAADRGERDRVLLLAARRGARPRTEPRSGPGTPRSPRRACRRARASSTTPRGAASRTRRRPSPPRPAPSGSAPVGPRAGSSGPTARAASRALLRVACSRSCST